MNALLLGGTRNLGPAIVDELLARGYRVTVFHRGLTNTPLPPDVERLHGDRSSEADLRQALGHRDFDLLVDTTLYTGPEAELAARLFAHRVGRYIMLSTGQVYLVRLGLARPFREDDYAGPVMPPPPAADHPDWLYGIDKRAAEDALLAADLPVTILRLPMVNSARDHYNRLGAYLARLHDGGPILLPAGPHLPLKHLYGPDVAQTIGHLAASPLGLRRAYNLSQDEAPTIEDFLAELARLADRPLRLRRIPRERLEAEGLLLDCSPYSGRWMSAVDNARAKAELGLTFTPWHAYLPVLVDQVRDAVRQVPPRYAHRAKELALSQD